MTKSRYSLGVGEAFPESEESQVANATSIGSFRLRSGTLEETNSFVLDKSICEELETENLILVSWYLGKGRLSKTTC